MSAAKKLDSVKVSQTLEELVDEVSKVVTDIAGIQLGKAQFSMVSSRVQRRMIKLGIKNCSDYSKYLKANIQIESEALLSLLTTHHTHFFREFQHFEFLSKEGLKKIIDEKKKNGSDKVIRIWSAACSRGQEVYSLAMYLKHHLPQIDSSFDFEILGTDIDPESVKLGKNGVYRWDEIKEAPVQYLGSLWKKGKSEIADFVRASDDLRKHCHWGVENLVQLKPAPQAKKFDFIFCRNVFIYFNEDQIRTITQNLFDRLENWGYLLVGLSESLLKMSIKAEYVGPSIYQKENAGPKSKNIQPAAPKPMPIYKVFCVDDSSTVLTLLKKILTKDAGFEVVDTAKSGKEAQQKVNSGLVFDLMTLDLQMPEMGGLDYLRSIKGKQHPPIVVVSSMAREDSEGGIAALALGARDFVEKPTLANLAEKSEEIRFKLLCSRQATNPKSNLSKTGSTKSSVEKSFSFKGFDVNVAKTLRIVWGGFSDREKILEIGKSSTSTDAPTLFFLDGPTNFLGSLVTDLTRVSPNPVKIWEAGHKLEAGSVVFLANPSPDFIKGAKEFCAKLKVSHCILGGAHKKFVSEVSAIGQSRQIIIEDSEILEDSRFLGFHLKEGADHVVPPTSFVYHSLEFLGEPKK